MAISATEVHVTVPTELPVAGSVPALTRDAGFVTTTVTVTPSTSRVRGGGGGGGGGRLPLYGREFGEVG